MANDRKALILSHVAFEDLGSLQAPLEQRNFEIATVVAASAPFPWTQAAAADLLIVMGGPIGVYEQQEYPFLVDEISCIRERLQAGKPILGICLGAQLMAAALGSRVYPGQNGKEIGWSEIHPAEGSVPQKWFQPLLTPGLRVLHWHGDTFDLPSKARLLASSDLYPNQAFTVGNFALGLQFHPEVTANGLESWYVGHACELSHARISVPSLRADAQAYGPVLEAAAETFWDGWLDAVL